MMTATPAAPVKIILIILLLSTSSADELAAISSSSGSTPTSAECPSPRLLSFLPHRSSSTCTAAVPSSSSSSSLTASSQLGDYRRSPSATSRFFHSLDTDSSGAISRDEISHFLKSRIGGSQFADSSVVRNEAGLVMNALDVDHNNNLELEDVEGYWSRLDSLLTSREVSEWLVHAVQLPKEVGQLFLEHGITGYDFPEIVQNSGRVLSEELGLKSKSQFVNKIVSAVQARMLGIGSTPSEIENVEIALTNCRSVGLKWGKSSARIFPVHSYRIQRRAVNLFDSSSSNYYNNDDFNSQRRDNHYDDSMIADDGKSVSSSLQSIQNSGWKTMYEGGETEYVDSTLEMGHIYTYRIQAWNAAGRSPWEYVELEKILKKKGCSTTKPRNKERKKSTTSSSSNSIVTMRGIDFTSSSNSRRHDDDHDDDEESWEWLSTPKRIIWTVVFAVQFVYHSARAFFMVIAAGGAIMRFKRASATSSASATASLPFPQFWKGLNRLSVKLTGHECIPPSMLGDGEARLRQEQMHDDHVGATGLRGYAARNPVNHQAISSGIGGGGINNNADVARSRNLIRREGSNLALTNSTNSLNSLSVGGPLKPPEEVTVAKKSITKRKFAFRFPSGKKSNSSGALSSIENNELTTPSSTINRTRSQQNNNTQLITLEQIHSPNIQSQPLIDDGTVCIVCQKIFKIGKRYRHYCSRCMSTFCHKHGKTTHSNLTSCRVPGSCLCNPCLEEVMRNSSSISVT